MCFTLPEIFQGTERERGAGARRLTDGTPDDMGCPFRMIRCVLVLAVIVASSCSNRPLPAPPHTDGVTHLSHTDSPPRATQQGHRVVHLSSPVTDTSCLGRMGGTKAAAELTDDDVRQIESLIRRVDDLPIIAIDRPSEFAGRHNRRAPSFDFEAMTGVGCGPLSGHGSFYELTLVNGEWMLTPGGSWVS
jgi:hypothetical protein